MPKNILVLNGPNANLLGVREPHIYGYETLSDLEKSLAAHASSLPTKPQVSMFQSNHEGSLIGRIHGARTEGVDAIIINPGPLTHTSVGLRDALMGVDIPFVEVHITNIHQRESFRHHSFFSDKAVAVIAGLGLFGYTAALDFIVMHMKP